MFTVITGPPGVGKTSRLLGIACSTERPVYHNIDVLKGGVRLDGADRKISPVPVHPLYFFRMSTQEHIVARCCFGSVFMIDEAHLFFRDVPRDETDIIGFIENHCAYGIDIYVAVQRLSSIPYFCLPDVFYHESYFYRRYSHFFRRFGFLTCSVYRCRMTPSGPDRTLEKPFALRRFSYPRYETSA